MQSPGDEGSWEGRGEASSGPEERDSKPLDDGSDRAANDSEANGPTTRERGPRDRLEQSTDDLRPQPHPDHSGTDEFPAAATDSVQENAAQPPLIPYLSNLSISEEMEDQESLPEEQEELVVLDSENPLVKAYQANLNSHLRKRLEMLTLELREKRGLEKAEANQIKEMSVELFRTQEQLAKFHTKLDECHHTEAQAEAKHHQTQEQLETTKRYFSNIKSQERKAKASVSQLEAELDRLMLHLSFIEGVSKDLQSNVKITKNVKHKAGAVKNQAEEQKLKQDLYVERLKKDLERLTQQIAMYETQTTAQAEETQAAKEALSEAEMEMASVVMARKQLLQKWSSSLMELGRRDEAFSAMQEAVRNVDHQVILLGREIEGYKKCITEEQEKNEKLTMQLNWSQMDCATSKKLISQKQNQQEALQAQYSTCLRTLRETEHTLARLSKETGTHQTEVNNQRRQLEKESAARLELEDKIMSHMQQELTHNKAAKYSQRLTKKLTALKKDKISQLWQLENDLVTVGLESSIVSQHLDSLALSQKDLDEEIAKYNKLLASNQAKISSFVTLIGQKQATITNYNNKIYQIRVSTGHVDMSPQQIKVHELMSQIEELATIIKRDQQLWMKQQETLVGMTKEIQANSKNMLKLQTEYTNMQQKKICLESQIEVEHREQKELEKNVMMLRKDQEKLSTLISKKGQLSLALEQENALMEKDFLCRLKEAELESIKLQMKHEKTQEEKERLHSCLVEAERHILLWQKKTQLMKETQSVVDSMRKGDIQMMQAEINRMKFRLNKLKKEQQQLLKSYGAEMERWQKLEERKFDMRHSSKTKSTKTKTFLKVQGLQRKIKETHKNVVKCELVIRELQETKMSLKDRTELKKQHLIELCSTSSIFESDVVNLQDVKYRNFSRLVTLQSRNKRLQRVREGTYKALSTSESVDAALQNQMERVHAVSAIIHHVCEEFPQHQGALRRLSLTLAEHAQPESKKHPTGEGKM